MEYSAEWLRGAVAVLGRMVDECDIVFTGDLPHITKMGLQEQYLPEYAKLLAAAEAREAGEPSAAGVIREAKAALEIAQQASGSRLFHDSRRKALATISAWEAGNDLL